MNTEDFDELAGRMNGMGQALLRVVAELEFEGFIDGPRVSASLRRAAGVYSSGEPVQRSSQTVLLQLAQLLDEARAARQARLAPG